MQSEQIVKDILELHARLLDHRPVLQGHLSYFVKEFEEKRGQQEVQKLSKTKSDVQQIKDTLLPETTDAMQTFISNISAKLKVATEVCCKIEEKEGNVGVCELEKERERRNANWKSYMEIQKENCAHFDQEIEEQISKLNLYYKELEEKLMTTSNVP